MKLHAFSIIFVMLQTPVFAEEIVSIKEACFRFSELCGIQYSGIARGLKGPVTIGEGSPNKILEAIHAAGFVLTFDGGLGGWFNVRKASSERLIAFPVTNVIYGTMGFDKGSCNIDLIYDAAALKVKEVYFESGAEKHKAEERRLGSWSFSMPEFIEGKVKVVCSGYQVRWVDRYDLSAPWLEGENRQMAGAHTTIQLSQENDKILALVNGGEGGLALSQPYCLDKNRNTIGMKADLFGEKVGLLGKILLGEEGKTLTDVRPEILIIPVVANRGERDEFEFFGAIGDTVCQPSSVGGQAP